jgi:cytochrome c oxidase cbb3-type subunit II
MSFEKDEKPKEVEKVNFFYRLEYSAIITVIGILLLFSTSIITILIAPRYIDTSWTTPSSPYQAQMYDVEDPNIYISNASSGGVDLQYVRHLKKDFTLLAFKETEELRLLKKNLN